MGTLLHCWWECKLIQPLWRTVWRFLKKLKVELLYDPAIPFLGMYPEKTMIQKDTCNPIFTVALFTIARSWKQPKCPSTGEWIKKMWHKKEQNWVIFRDVDGPGVCYSEWTKSEREKQISYINAYIWNLEKWYRLTSLQGRNRDTDVENKCMDTKGGKLGDGMNWEIGIDIYTLICIK